MQSISFETAMAITGLGRTSLWRRISTDRASRDSMDQTKGHPRIRIDLDRAIVWSGLTLEEEDRALVLDADGGNSAAQCDLGLLLLEVGQPKRGIYWLEQAAEQGNADAMQWLGKCHASGEGVEKDEEKAQEWIKKAAQHGSLVAQRQMLTLGL